MTRYFLERLTVEGFRGINNDGAPLELRFKPDAVNSVFGANGCGKSSVFEALCYAIRGKVPRLEKLQAADEGRSYYANRFHGSGHASIGLTLAPDDGGAAVRVLVERTPAGERRVSSPSGHPDPETLLRGLDDGFVLLDHAAFQDFVEDSALDRGRAFSGLLGLSALSEHRQALQMLCATQGLNADLGLPALQQESTDAEASLRAATRRASEAYAALAGATAPVPDPFDRDEVVAAATAILRGIPVLSDLFAADDIATVDFEAVRSAIRDAEGGARREALAAILRAIGELEALAPAEGEEAEVAALEALVDERETALAATRGDHFRRMFEAVDLVIRSEAWDDPARCPACESRPDTPANEHVAAQLSQFAAVRTAQSGIAARSSAPWIERLGRLEASAHLAVPEAERLHRPFSAACEAGTLEKAALRDAAAALPRLERRRADALVELGAERERLGAELPPSLVELTERVEAARRIREALQEREAHAAKHASATARLRARRRWKEFVLRACEVFSAAEEELSSSRTAALETSYKDMFKAITYDDVVPQLRKPPGSEDLHLRLERFHGQGDLAALPLLSESYRSTLGISIFLSAALQSRGAARFIVLDDVTSSFDAGRQWLLMELLRSRIARPGNPDGPQVVVLSHDGLLQKYFDKLSSAAGWHHQLLQGRPPRGNVLSQTHHGERLRAEAVRLLDAGMADQAAPFVRQHLEYKLLQVIGKVGIPVPLDFAMKDHKRMVANCIDAISDAVALHEAAGRLALDAGMRHAAIEVQLPAIVGNAMSHYETASGVGVAPGVLVAALDAVDAFADCFRYDCVCDGGPPKRRYLKSLAEKACRC
jgi:energy-coupling factor transporter ATP-binding protein EcfA2